MLTVDYARADYTKTIPSSFEIILGILFKEDNASQHTKLQ